MIEPTESENKAELDRFCDAMLGIREEIRRHRRMAQMDRGKQPAEKCASHRWKIWSKTVGSPLLTRTPAAFHPRCIPCGQILATR